MFKNIVSILFTKIVVFQKALILVVIVLFKGMNTDETTMKMWAKELAVPVKQEISAEKKSKNMLSIILAQRDRLHHQVEGLEQDLINQKQTNKYLENERDKIREDNIKLYGKIKFLQSYQSKLGQVGVFLYDLLVFVFIR